MRTRALVEVLAGVGSGVIGLLILAYLLFAPILRDTSEMERGDGTMAVSVTYASAVQHGLPTFYVAFFTLLALVLAGVALCAVLHALTRRGGWRRLLIALVAALLLLVVFLFVTALDYLPPHVTARALWSALSATGGAYLLPSVALALVALAFARPGRAAHALAAR